MLNTCKMTDGSNVNKITKNKNTISLEELKLSKAPEDGLIGVERKRIKTKKFFLTGIAENLEESQI